MEGGEPDYRLLYSFESGPSNSLGGNFPRLFRGEVMHLTIIDSELS